MAQTQTLPVSSAAQPASAWREKITEPGLTVLVSLELVGIFLIGPLSEMHLWPLAGNVLVILLVLAATIMVVWWNRIAVTMVIGSFALGLVTAVLRHEVNSAFVTVLDFAAKLIFLGTSTVVVGVTVFGPGRVTLHRIRGAVAIYLQIAMIFSYIYLLLAHFNPQAFHPEILLSGPTGDILRGASGGSGLVHFSFVTLTSTGYGDIVPVHPLARSTANLEALVGQLFPATILARLVTLELESRRKS
jgi:voltage-gated potassium channel Kch